MSEGRGGEFPYPFPQVGGGTSEAAQLERLMESCVSKATISAVMGSVLGFGMGVFFSNMSAMPGAPPPVPLAPAVQSPLTTSTATATRTAPHSSTISPIPSTLTLTSSSKSPSSSTWTQVKDGFRASGRNGVRYAKGFGAAGGMFVAAECTVEKMRGKSDIYNSVVGGCAAGAALSARGGAQAAVAGCAGFAAFSALIEMFIRGED